MTRVLEFPRQDQRPDPASPDGDPVNSGMAARGVWRAPYDQEGHHVYMAIDRGGRCVASATILPGLRARHAHALLLEILNAVDPSAGVVEILP